MTVDWEHGRGELALGWEFDANMLFHPGPPPAMTFPPPPPKFGVDEEDALRQMYRPHVENAASSTGCGLGTLLVLVLGFFALLVVIGTSFAVVGVVVIALGLTLFIYKSRRRAPAADTSSVADSIINARRESIERDRAQHAAAVQRIRSQHSLDTAAWQTAVALWQGLPTFFPVAPAGGGRLVDVYGGLPRGWSAMTTTIGLEVAAAGGRATVIDLTELAVAQPLVDVSVSAGTPVSVKELPRDIHEIDLLSGLSPDGVAEVLANALSAADEHTSQSTKALDHFLVSEITHQLVAPLTIRKLSRACRVMLREAVEPSTDGVTAQEIAALQRLIGSEMRDRSDVGARITMLLSQLSIVDVPGDAAPNHTEATVEVMSLQRHAAGAQNDVIANLLIASVIRRLRDANVVGSALQVLLLLGADRLPEQQLDDVRRLADHAGVHVFTFQTQFTELHSQRAGTGGRVVALMRLGNNLEAERAATLLGQHHQFILSDLSENTSRSNTITIGRSYTVTAGTSDSSTTTTGTSTSETSTSGTSTSSSWSDNGGSSSDGTNSSFSTGTSTSQSFASTVGTSFSESWGVNSSEADGTTEGESRSFRRSLEYRVEPQTLRQLAETAFILLEQVSGADGPRLVAGDCNPAIGTLRETSQLPKKVAHELWRR